MNTPLVVATIAAITSLIGTSIALFIARQTRMASLAQDQFRLLLKLNEERIARLRTLSSATERLRAAGILLRSDLERRSRTGSGDVGAAAARVKQLAEEFDSFWMKWAEVKDDIPDADLGRLRRLRHTLRSDFKVLPSIAVDAQSGQQVDEDSLKNVSALFDDVLLKLDEFYIEIAQLRSSAVEAAVLSQSSLWMSASTNTSGRNAQEAMRGILPTRRLKKTPDS